VWLVAATLAALSVAFGRSSPMPWVWGAALVALAGIGAGPWAWARSLGESLSLREAFGEDVVYLDERRCELGVLHYRH